MKNINIIEGVPVTFEMDKTGVLKSIYFNDIIIDVIKMTPHQKNEWCGNDKINGSFWIDIFIDSESLSQTLKTKSVDSFHGGNYNLNKAIHSLI